MSKSPFSSKAMEVSPDAGREYDDGKYFSREETDVITPRQWCRVTEDNYMAISDTDINMPSGVYEITLDQQSGKPVFIKKTIVHDKLIPLLGLPKEIIREINSFWCKEEEFTKLGFLHRRGYLFYGSHGTGKSSLVHEIIDDIVSKDGIVFFCQNPEFFNNGLKLFRQIEPTRKIVCVFEDVDALIKKYGEAELLSLLDGENQVSRVCNLATTNYPEILDKRIVGRPRRFDRVYKISNLDTKARTAYLKKKLPKGQNLNEWVKKTDGLTIASISETIISVFCFNKGVDEAIDIVKSLTKDKNSKEYKDMGFDPAEEDEG